MFIQYLLVIFQSQVEHEELHGQKSLRMSKEFNQIQLHKMCVPL